MKYNARGIANGKGSADEIVKQTYYSKEKPAVFGEYIRKAKETYSRMTVLGGKECLLDDCYVCNYIGTKRGVFLRNKNGLIIDATLEKLKTFDRRAETKNTSVKDHDIDAFGDAYEYLMTMYASNAGKSGGEFFTPADVSELLTRLGTVGKKTVNKVYDPACGSGSLLLKAEKVLGRDSIKTGFFGQEINITTYNLCRINMFLHDIGFDKFDIECEDTLTNPQHQIFLILIRSFSLLTVRTWIIKQ